MSKNDEVTATIVNAAFQRQQEDHEMVAREQKIKSDRLIEEVKTLFMEMDKSLALVLPTG